MGFLDAEGNFQVFPKKRVNKNGEITHYGVGYHFHLGLSVRDLTLLKFIMSILGDIGKIYLYPEKEEAHYAISRVAEILWLVEAILQLNPLLTMNQASRYNQLQNGLLSGISRFNTLIEFLNYFAAYVIITQPSINNISQLFIDSWIVGFINGEGCFTHSQGATGASFVIEHTDKGVLDMIKLRLNFGPSVISRPRRGNRKLTYSLSVTTEKDLKSLVNFLDSNIPLQGYKYVQYMKWRKDTLKW